MLRLTNELELTAILSRAPRMRLFDNAHSMIKRHNPAAGLKGFRITKKNRPISDRFTIQEAEPLSAAIHRDRGEEARVVARDKGRPSSCSDADGQHPLDCCRLVFGRHRGISSGER